MIITIITLPLSEYLARLIKRIYVLCQMVFLDVLTSVKTFYEMEKSLLQNYPVIMSVLSLLMFDAVRPCYTIERQCGLVLC